MRYDNFFKTAKKCFLSTDLLTRKWCGSSGCQVSFEKKSKRKVRGVLQSQAAAHPIHEEEEETDKTKQAQIKQTHEKHQN